MYYVSDSKAEVLIVGEKSLAFILWGPWLIVSPEDTTNVCDRSKCYTGQKDVKSMKSQGFIKVITIQGNSSIMSGEF